MKRVAVDASVAIKWFVPEIHSLDAARLLDEEFVLCAPDLMGPEFANTLWKKARRREISQSEADEILGVFKKLPIEVVPSQVLLEDGFQMAVRLDCSVYDSLYLAVALYQDCPLVTADRKFHSAVAASPFASHVRWVEDET